MTIRKEINAWEIKSELWSGALDTFETIAKNNKVGDLIELLEELYPEGADITFINDLLWFDDEFIYSQLNIKDEKIYPFLNNK